MCYRSGADGDGGASSLSRARPLAASGEYRATRSRRSAKSTLRPSYGMGMWRAVTLLVCLSTAAHAAVFTEGGAVLNGQDLNDQKLLEEEFERELALEKNRAELMKYTQKDDKKPVKGQDQHQSAEKQPEQQEPIEYNQDAFDDKAYMEFITQELIKQRQQQEELERQQHAQSYNELYPFSEMIETEQQGNGEEKVVLKNEKSQASIVEEMKKVMPEPLTDEELEKFEEFLRKAETENYHEFADKTQELNRESVENAMETATGEPQMKQKKGQNEFVSFVEPEQQPMKQTVSSQVVDKRRLATSAEFSERAPRYSSSSLLLLAVGTVMSVGIVGTVAGGAYYWKRRNDTPDDGEYAPYAGTGPGFKKTKGAQCDETLAYKAQLHQYQQAKQKIICGEDAPGIIESDGEDGADEENNYSVYECPGLAPTGDIEVCNPNFAAQP